MSLPKDIPTIAEDPKGVALRLEGIIQEIEMGKIEVLGIDKLDFRGTTTLWIKFRTTQETPK